MLLGQPAPRWHGQIPYGRAGREGRTKTAHGVVQTVRRELQNTEGAMGYPGLYAVHRRLMPCQVLLQTAGSKLGLLAQGIMTLGRKPCVYHASLTFQTVPLPCTVSEGKGICRVCVVVDAAGPG